MWQLSLKLSPGFYDEHQVHYSAGPQWCLRLDIDILRDVLILFLTDETLQEVKFTILPT